MQTRMKTNTRGLAKNTVASPQFWCTATLAFDRLERPLPSEAEGDRFESCQVRPTG
jgi:hypothetical protein